MRNRRRLFPVQAILFSRIRRGSIRRRQGLRDARCMCRTCRNAFPPRGSRNKCGDSRLQVPPRGALCRFLSGLCRGRRAGFRHMCPFRLLSPWHRRIPGGSRDKWRGRPHGWRASAWKVSCSRQVRRPQPALSRCGKAPLWNACFCRHSFPKGLRRPR